MVHVYADICRKKWEAPSRERRFWTENQSENGRIRDPRKKRPMMVLMDRRQIANTISIVGFVSIFRSNREMDSIQDT